MQEVRRFADPEYATLSLAMRDGRHADAVFDRLVARGQVVVHSAEAERTDALARAGAGGALVVADTREQVASLNAAIRNDHGHDLDAVVTQRGDRIGLGDRVATRRNDPGLGVANRQTWTVVGMGEDGSLIVHAPGQRRDRALPAEYVREHVELSYATTIYGAQGETVDHAHVAIGGTTGAAAAYVAMTRGRQTNVAHLVAESLEDARKQWIDAFGRDRADLGPAHARGRAIEAIDRYGPAAMRHTGIVPPPPVAAPNHGRASGIGL
jgi:ATP-dependent exoDNAse (exonuclease V) alpha subunit